LIPMHAVARVKDARGAGGEPRPRKVRIELHVAQQQLARVLVEGNVEAELPVGRQRALEQRIDAPRLSAVVRAEDVLSIQDIEAIGPVGVDEEPPHARRLRPGAG
jgi:hypothetical protein